jgi:acetyl esterase/lipase
MVKLSDLSYNPTQTFEVETYDLDYRRGGDQSWAARIYQPKGSGPFPAILDVHGGAWNGGQRTNNQVMDQVLAASGIVVAAVDFRLAPVDPYPAQVQDVNFAARWLKAHAGDFNADPDSIGGLGSSSGGHTVMLSAMRPGDPRYASLPLPEAQGFDATLLYLLCCWPVLDPYARYLYARNVGDDRLVTSTEAYFLDQATLHEGNPQEILERREAVDLPPAIIIQGTNDSNVPLSIPQKFETAYRDAGGSIELEMFDGMPHGFGNQPFPESQRAIEMMKVFIARQLARPAVVGV